MKTKGLFWAFAFMVCASFVLGAPGNVQQTPPLKASLTGWQVWLGDGERILPSTLPPPSATNASIRIVSARNASATALFAIRAGAKIDNLTFSIEGLPGDAVPESGRDIKVLKAWFQDASGWFSGVRAIGNAILVPELLLHDDSLVKIDVATKENLIKGADGAYRRIKAVDAGMSSPVMKGFVAADDSDKLLPLSIAQNETRAFFFKFDVPESAKPGIYHAKVNLSSATGSLGYISLKFRIIDGVLEEGWSRFASIVNLDGRQVPSGTSPAIVSTTPELFTSVAFLPSERISRSSIEFLHRYGIKSVALPKEKLPLLSSLYPSLPKTLWVAPENALLRKPSGIREDGVKELLDCADKALATKVKDVRIFAGAYAIPYEKVPTEKDKQSLAADRIALEALAAKGVKTWVNSSYVTFTNCADVITNPFDYGLPREKILSSSHSPENPFTPYGHYEERDTRLNEYWRNVGTPNLLAVTASPAIENYAFWRRSCGMEPFFLGYDGLIFPGLVDMKHSDPWNDWANMALRSQTLLYPTKSSFVTTLAFEGLADGLTDYRYLSTVRRLATSIRALDYRLYKFDLEGRKAGVFLQWINPKKSALDATRYEAVAWLDKLSAVSELFKAAERALATKGDDK